MHYTVRRYEDGSNSRFDFKLRPFSITSFPDTIISYERFRYYSDNIYWPYSIDEPRIDSVSLTIKNKIINSLSLFPYMEGKSDSVNTHYPSDYENPHQTNKNVTLSREDGVISIGRCYDCNSKFRTVIRTVLNENN